MGKASIKSSLHKVLLIEDDPKELEYYSDLIREVADCKIDVLDGPWESSEWISRSNYHLIIIASSTHGMGLLEQIKRLSPATSVILVSATANVEEAVAAIRMGAEDYLGKPFKMDAFQMAVKRGLDRKAIFGEDTGASSFLHLLNSCQMISASLEQSKIFETIQSYLARELNAGYSAIYSLHGNDLIRIDGSERGEYFDRTLEEVLDISLRTSGAVPALQNSSEFFRFVDRGQLTPSLFLFRFQCAGESDYFCACLSPENPSDLAIFESRLRMLKAQIEVTGKNIEHYMGVQQLVYLDDATGLYNTRYLNYILDREIAQAELTQKSFAVLFIDADRFKLVNDTHGHLVGTKLLNELGNHLKKYVREKDTVFRYGGDEFVAVLSPCDLPTAKTVAERIRESVEKKVFLKNENLNIHFTISIGVALFPDHAKTKKEIIEAADQAMYRAKKTTRNSVLITQIPVDCGNK
jgi:diguanylate cyclase (GGDEF)-like protein